MSNQTIIPTETHARKILDLLSHGLVKGLGRPVPGEMCVEAAVCYALGLPHGDNPPCVGEEVRKFKITLNDDSWPDNLTRAKGMRELAIAQLGSNTLDQDLFRRTIWFKCGTRLQPIIWRYLATKGNAKARLAVADKMERSTSLEECLDYAHAHAHAHDYDYAYGYDYDYDYDYAYGYGYGSSKSDWLTKVAAIGVETLIELNSPGCQWLHLCK